jgi:putative restriction endonuclease
MPRNNWTREELILTMNLYVKIPFGTIHTRNPKIIALADIIGRSVNSVTLRLTNFASHDPYHKARGIKGMSQSSKATEEVFNEFVNDWDNLLYESEKILAEKEQTTLEQKFYSVLNDIDLTNKKGEFKIREVKTRVNQSLFRQMVLANYNSKCAITGIEQTELLIASHIVPWAKNEKERLNPENGICLSSLYDKAFDVGLIGIDSNYKVVLSSNLKKSHKKTFYANFFGNFENKEINLPNKFLPKKDFLAYHFEHIFKV